MPSFLDDFGYLADTPAALSVIKGTYVPPVGPDPYLVKILSCLAMPFTIREFTPSPFVVNERENRLAWMKQGERTSGERSCLSFSHYKAASQDQMLNSVDTLLCMIPLFVGFSPEAWQVITDVEILKKASELRVAKMRLIQLMSPKFQINNKMIGRNILKHAETANAVAADQHGSRKHHTSINTCLNNNLVCDVLRQKNRAGAVAISDVKGCYDAISHPIAVLALMSFGVPQQVCKVLFSTLQKARHHIKTGFGRSEARDNLIAQLVEGQAKVIYDNLTREISEDTQYDSAARQSDANYATHQRSDWYRNKNARMSWTLSAIMCLDQKR